jgi:hypothetical protein
MRYWRRKSRSYSRPIGSKSYFSQREIDYTSSNFNPAQFLLQEFFKTTDSTLERIIEGYKRMHGDGAASYFKRRIVDWRCGNAAVTDLMKDRILQLMPRYLNEEKKFHLLKFEITKQINRLQTNYRNQTKSVNDISHIYQQEIEKINSIDNISLSWFTNKGIFSDDEKAEFVEISKYILKNRLILSYNQVKSDLQLIIPKLSNIKKGLEEVIYLIDYLNCKISLDKIEQIGFEKLHGLEAGPKELKTRYKPYIEKYIFYELNNVHYIKFKSEVEASLTENDFDVLIEHYNRLVDLDQEGDIKSTFKGEGGILTLSAKIKSLKNIRHDYLVSVLKLLGFLVFSIILVTLVIAFEWVNGFTLFFGLYFVTLAFSFLREILREINRLQSDLNKYGR